VANHLVGQTSPYLLQHAHNPVDWYPWGPEALERARTEGRLIFLSIGYSACHWCHVMERESFEDPEIAAQINRDFVAIKVDREERPDLDDVYMAAVQAMTGSGGWPMTVFLTPDLEPFFGGTYFPPADRGSLPGLPRVLAGVAEAYRERPDEVAAAARQLTAHLREQLSVDPGRVDPTRAQLDTAVVRLAATHDATWGGFGQAPKFPAPLTLEFLLRAWRRSRDPQTLAMVTRTLDAMAHGGLRDQLGGGFARYSTDGRWLVPHFEKMLSDNALLAHAYLEAFRATRRDRYAHIARETLGFMIRELETDAGGFASALDADSEGEEGRYYTWDTAEFEAVLADASLSEDEVATIAAWWGVAAGGVWEGHSILHSFGRPAPSAELVELARVALLAARERRVRPARDDKQLAAWNGMALRALAHAALVLGDDALADAARRVVGFVRKHLLRDGDRLWRTARGDSAHTPAFAEDYACLADGLLAAHAASGDPADLRLAERLMARAVRDFWDEASGTFTDTGPEHDGGLVVPRSLVDGATPSANAVAADVLLRLAVLLGEPEHDRRARRILRAVAPTLDRQPGGFARMLAAADRSLGEPLDVVIAGEPADAAALALRRAAGVPYAPDLVISGLPAASDLAGLPLYVGKLAVGGRPTAYLCRGYACDAPTEDGVRLREQVAALVSA